ncbi:unnamed protein product [Eruca vesicaria subsp. sativa]|uniref:Uncharacterized protein n=1 Tax=Eruca vesicaria subsp. sativa TaxID=29727 RepID=A0ABC8M2V3_ERUVS|nr:unnamed protein product [Eruca vesicaria subsp. sativa]
MSTFSRSGYYYGAQEQGNKMNSWTNGLKHTTKTFPGFSLEEQNKFFKRVYDVIYDSARTCGPCTGGVFWQHTTNYRTGLLGDGYEVFMQQGPNTTARLIAQQSIKLRNLKYPPLVTHSAA